MAMDRQPDNQRAIGAETSDQKATESYRPAMVATANDALRAGMLVGRRANCGVSPSIFLT